MGSLSCWGRRGWVPAIYWGGFPISCYNHCRKCDLHVLYMTSEHDGEEEGGSLQFPWGGFPISCSNHSPKRLYGADSFQSVGKLHCVYLDKVLRDWTVLPTWGCTLLEVIVCVLCTLTVLLCCSQGSQWSFTRMVLALTLIWSSSFEECTL